MRGIESLVTLAILNLFGVDPLKCLILSLPPPILAQQMASNPKRDGLQPSRPSPSLSGVPQKLRRLMETSCHLL